MSKNTERVIGGDEGQEAINIAKGHRDASPLDLERIKTEEAAARQDKLFAAYNGIDLGTLPVQDTTKKKKRKRKGSRVLPSQFNT